MTRGRGRDMLDDWTTIRWLRAGRRAILGRLMTREFVARVAALVLCLAVAAAPLAFVVDAALMWHAHAGVADALVIGFVAAALACLFALVLVLPLAAVVEIIAATAQHKSRARWLWPLPLLAASLAVPLWMLDREGHGARIEIMIAAITGALFVMGVLARANRRAARVLSLVIAAGAVAFDVTTPRHEYRDLHDLAGLLAACGLLAAITPLRRWLARSPVAELRVAIIAIVAASVGVTYVSTRIRPGWRASAVAHAEYMPRLARALRALVDFDGDGFSPVAWGGDCNDFDAARNPLAHEDAVGRDMNCNGQALAAHPEDADRGLTRPFGDPDLARGQIDLALLVTVDCLASDAFTPEVMPRLTEYARRGVVFTRLYAGGSRTHLSLPLMQRASDRSLPVTAHLAAAGVLSTAVLGYYDQHMGDIVAGFRVLNLQTYEKPFNPQIALASPLSRIEGEADATAITNRALDDLREHDRQLHYLWLHYFDTHWPYRSRPAAERIAAPPGKSQDFGKFLTETHHVDAEIGRLLDRLDQDGRLQRSLIIVTADHGEGFGRHNIRYHGVSAYDMLVHVPGFLIAPGLAAGHYDGLVTHRDIPATLLGAFAQVAHEPAIERFGRSWLRLRAAPRAPLHRFVVTRSSRAVEVSGFVMPMAAIIQDRYKLVVTFEDGLVELYDLRADPDEQTDLAPEIRAPQLRRALEIYRDIDGYP
jgi:hypothetical protein